MDIWQIRSQSPTTDYIEENFEAILGDVDSSQRTVYARHIQRFDETLVRLMFRRNLYLASINEIRALDPESSDCGEELHWLQLQILDRIEAFHQVIYASLSALVALLNYKPGMIGAPQYNIGSITKTIDQIEGEFRYNSIALDAITTLRKSVDFRNKFVDHPQQNQLHDWYSHGLFDRYYIVYFKRTSDSMSVIHSPQHDPELPGFVPAVACGDDFYVSP